MEFITISAGDSVLTLAPGLGGSIVSWLHRERAMLRPPLPGAVEKRFVRGLGCFPLVPYSNRIARGHFRFGGTEHQVPATFGGNAIHGVGWEKPWQATRPDPTRVTLTLDHVPDATWPYAFRAEQRYVLAQDQMIVHLLMQSLHHAPAPAGIGLHPFFPRSPEAKLQFGASTVWENGPDMIPTQRIAIPPAWDHTQPKQVGSAVLDNCFAGWRGTARLSYPDLGYAMTMEAEPVFRHLVVFVPEGKPFFAVEPVTNMNDGVNRMDDTPGHGVTVLAPGEILAGRVTFRIETAHA